MSSPQPYATSWNPREALSPLSCPIPAVTLRGDVQDVESRCMHWLTEFELLDDPEHRKRIIGTDAATMMCLWAPDGTTELTALAAQWAYLAFAIDDARFDTGPYRASPSTFLPMTMRLLQCIDHPEAADGDDPYVRAYRDLSHRIREAVAPEVARRWAEGCHDSFFGSATVVGHRSAGTLPSLDAYMNLGPRDRGIRLCFTAIEISEGTALPIHEIDSPGVRATAAAAGLMVTLSNDLFSYNHEREQGALESNVINILMHQEGLNLKTATDRGLVLREGFQAVYLLLRKTLERDASAELTRYLGQLDHFIRGDLQWSTTSPRYRTYVPGETVVTISDEIRSIPEAPPYPSVRWIWDIAGQLHPTSESGQTVGGKLRARLVCESNAGELLVKHPDADQQ